MISAAGRYMEFDEEAKLSFNDSLKELSDVNKMSKEVVLGFNIPSAPNNDYLFRKYGLGRRIPCRLTSIQNDGFDLIFELATAKSYKISLRKNANDWVKWAANTKLCELDLGRVEHTGANILATWNSDRDRYGSGSSGVYPIYGNFGSQVNPDRLSSGDIRYATHGYDILKKAFCNKGITFRSPVLEAHPHLWDYICKERFWEYDGHGDLVNAELSLSDFHSEVGNAQMYIPWDIIETDNGNNISNLGTDNVSYTPPYPDYTDYNICFEGRFNVGKL